MTDTTTYYDILNIPRNADQSTIRKAYLRASLACHPDKNPGNESQAKLKFIEIGEAYNVLKDPTKRAWYDRELGAGRCRERRRRTADRNSDAATNTKTTDETDREFQNFMDMFDSTVAGMTPEELNMAMGAAAVVGSIIGSLVGSRAGGKANSLLGTAASMVGSAVASHAAVSLVKTVHEDSTQRVLEKEDRDAAIQRGENVSQPTSDETRERLIRDAVGAVQKMAAAAAAAFATPSNPDVPDGGRPNLNSQYQRNISFGNNGSIRFTFGNNGGGARSTTTNASSRMNSARANSARANFARRRNG